MTAYYNEHDPFAAQWLRNLIAAKLIAPGDVDERSIEDVVPLELLKYIQCHFFAGIGVWSYSMRRAGWPDNRRAWSGSCPCQPFSQSGQGKGFADERHLWPALFHLIEQCGPDVIFGEQVASKDGFAWLDLVQNDMEAANYAFGALVTPAAGYGAPHIRHRTYWTADADKGQRRSGRNGPGEACRAHDQFARLGFAGESGDTIATRFQERISDSGISGGEIRASAGQATLRTGIHVGGLADADSESRRLSEHPGRSPVLETSGSGEIGRASATNGFWSDADWFYCRDGKWRPVEPGAFPLAYGAANRVGRLRGYGNAIVAPQAEEFIRVAMEYAP